MKTLAFIEIQFQQNIRMFQDIAMHTIALAEAWFVGQFKWMVFTDITHIFFVMGSARVTMFVLFFRLGPLRIGKPIIV